MSTTGIELNTRRRGLADAVELVSSMRFAISLLVLLAIAAIIGTVLRQGDMMPNYVNQFGPFWYEVFRKFGLYTVYTAWWFLLILLVLIVSTSLCLIRNAPKMMRDMRSWRESVREESLRNFHHKSEWTAPLDAAALAQQSAVRLGHAGYKVKIVEKEHGILVAAKKGAGNKFGYIFAHTAIIVILLGGMLDSELPIRLQQWFLGKTPLHGQRPDCRRACPAPPQCVEPDLSRQYPAVGRADRAHRHHRPGQRLAAAGIAVRPAAEEIPHRLLFDRDAEAVRQRRRRPRPRGK